LISPSNFSHASLARFFGRALPLFGCIFNIFRIFLSYLFPAEPAGHSTDRCWNLHSRLPAPPRNTLSQRVVRKKPNSQFEIDLLLPRFFFLFRPIDKACENRCLLDTITRTPEKSKVDHVPFVFPVLFPSPPPLSPPPILFFLQHPPHLSPPSPFGCCLSPSLSHPFPYLFCPHPPPTYCSSPHSFFFLFPPPPFILTRKPDRPQQTNMQITTTVSRTSQP